MKTIQKVTKIAAIILIVVGCIHQAATPMAFNEVPEEIRWMFTFMFLGTGFAFIYFGIVLLREAARMKGGANVNLWLTVSTLLLVLALSVMAVIILTENPFTWTLLITSLTALLIIMIKSSFSFKIINTLANDK